jgi:hypothetical protein
MEIRWLLKVRGLKERGITYWSATTAAKIGMLARKNIKRFESAVAPT